MSLVKLSQIPAAVFPFASTDTIVGVQGGTTDVQYQIGQIAFAFHVGTGTTLTFYVATTGSDSNNGMSPATAFATLQGAVNFIATNVLFAGGTVLLNIGSGTFLGVDFPTINGGGIFEIYGAGSTLTTVIADPAGHHPPGCFVWHVPNPEITFFIDKIYLAPRTNRFAYLNDFNVDLRLGQQDQSGHDLQYEHSQFGGFMAGYCNDQGPQGTGVSTFIGGGFTSAQIFSVSGLGGSTPPTYTSFAYGSTVTGSWTITQGWVNCIGGQFAVNNVFAGGWTTTGTVTGSRWASIQAGNIGTFGGGSPGGLGRTWFPGSSDGFGDGTSSYDGFGTTGEFDDHDPVTFWGMSTPGQALFWQIFANTSFGVSGKRNVYYIGVNDGILYGKQISRLINTQTGNYTFAIDDYDGRVEANSAGALTFTIPTHASVAFPVTAEILISNIGAGALTIAAAVGVTLRNPGALSTGRLYQRAVNDWVMTGA